MKYAVVVEDSHRDLSVSLFDEYSDACAYVKKEYDWLYGSPDKVDDDHEDDYSWAQVAWMPDSDYVNPQPDFRMCCTLTVVPVSEPNV